jgi:hypothetical protein
MMFEGAVCGAVWAGGAEDAAGGVARAGACAAAPAGVPPGVTGFRAGAAGAEPPAPPAGVPPEVPPPPIGATRVDRMGVFPVPVRFVPSRSGITSLRVPLSRTIRSGEISVIVYPW